jgi:hypothetical protein
MHCPDCQRDSPAGAAHIDCSTIRHRSVGGEEVGGRAAVRQHELITALSRVMDPDNTFTRRLCAMLPWR